MLDWIKTPSNNLKTYVANRVTTIQDYTEKATWRHVPSSDNPADMLSRGIEVTEWNSSDLWWHGPSWIGDQRRWPVQPTHRVDSTLEMKTTAAVVAAVQVQSPILERFSKYQKMRAVVAWCLRFTDNARGVKQTGPLTKEYLEWAESVIIRKSEAEVFGKEVSLLHRKMEIPKKSRLLELNVFLDQSGLLRVGGRLQQATLPEEQKHQIILPAKHHVTKLILERRHRQLHHCGPEQLLSVIRQKYWPLSGRREAKKVTTRCIACFRRNLKPAEALMGQLPYTRITGGGRPSQVTGIDYAGPLMMKESRRRGPVHRQKVWIAVFVCFSIKAVHLELVTDLTTEAFMAALRRFFSRRGVCQQLNSDNATNFTGAAREMQEL